MKALRFPLIAAAILSAASSAFAVPFSVGVSVDKAIADMKAKKYKETGLAMGGSDDSIGLHFWTVDEGVLIAAYAKKNRKITSLSFRLSDERPRSIRKEFDFSVTSFDPDTGVMTMQTKQLENE